MSDNPSKYEVLIKQYSSSIVDISGRDGIHPPPPPPPPSPTTKSETLNNILFGSLSNSEVPYKPLLLDYYFPLDSAKIIIIPSFCIKFLPQNPF